MTTRLCQIQYVSARQFGNNRALKPFFSGSLLGVEVKLCPESELWILKLPTGITRQSTGKSNIVAFQKLRHQQILQLYTEWHSSFKHAPSPERALMIHISWIKHRQQRHQQVSWTVCIRKTLYLSELQHIAWGQPVGSFECLSVW